MITQIEFLIKCLEKQTRECNAFANKYHEAVAKYITLKDEFEQYKAKNPPNNSRLSD